MAGDRVISYMADLSGDICGRRALLFHGSSPSALCAINESRLRKQKFSQIAHILLIFAATFMILDESIRGMFIKGLRKSLVSDGVKSAFRCVQREVSPFRVLVKFISVRIESSGPVSSEDIKHARMSSRLRFDCHL